MVNLAKLMRPVDMVAGGIVLVTEYKRALVSIPAVTVSLLIIYDKMIKRDNKSITESLTMGWGFWEIALFLIPAYIITAHGPNPIKGQAQRAILGGL